MKRIIHMSLQACRDIFRDGARALWAPLSISLLLPTLTVAQSADIQPDPVFHQRGTVLYWQHCSSCHGTDGDGQGPHAEFFIPRPRDFTVGNFKFTTSGMGEYPTRDDIIRAVDHGGEIGSKIGIPSFQGLNQMDRLALAEAIRVFAEIPEYAETFVVPPRPIFIRVEEGRELFSENGCIDCHGVNGDGRGVLAPELIDSRGNKATPANLTLGRFKGGNASNDIWMRIYAGIGGTPMPSFGRNLSIEEIWSLVDFVETFQAE
ncbi:MAG: c-type cytochrome [Paracoccaceae bacterium]